MKSIGRIARKTIGGMIPALFLFAVTPLAATPRQPLPAPWTGTIAHVTDGDTFRLTDGTRIWIADIDSAETQKRQAKCASEIAVGLRQKGDATALLEGTTVEVRPVGRSYAASSRGSAGGDAISARSWSDAAWRSPGSGASQSPTGAPRAGEGWRRLPPISARGRP